MKKCKKCSDMVPDKEQVCRLVDNDTGETFYFSVKLALRILKKNPRKPNRYIGRHLSYLVKNGPKNSHINHVDLDKIGIVGRTDLVTFIIDGNHRAAKKQKTNSYFYAYELTEFETGMICRTTPPRGKKFV